MVGPIDDEQRRVGRRWIATSFVLLVAASVGMMAITAGATGRAALATVVLGGLAGAVLVGYLGWILPDR